MSIDASEAGLTRTTFDVRFASLNGLPDTSQTKPTTLRTVTPIRELPETWIVQTIRRKEFGDTAFVEYVGPDGTVRIAIPPAVTDTLVRQWDALSATNRCRSAQAVGKAQAAARKAAGLQPAFMTPRKGKKGKRKS